MYKKIIHFIKYHNAFTIGLVLVMLLTVSAFATSPEIRESFISSEQIVRSVDNSYILTADLNQWAFNLTITDVQEDEDHYYINYTFETIALYDYLWQPYTQGKRLRVFKSVLEQNKQDLGLYAANQLSQVTEYELSYLKEVQTLQQKEGLTKKVVATEYSGLIGKQLNPKEKEFPGYLPVIEPKPAEPKTAMAEHDDDDYDYDNGDDPSTISEQSKTGDAKDEAQTVDKKQPISQEEQIAQIVNQILEEKRLITYYHDQQETNNKDIDNDPETSQDQDSNITGKTDNSEDEQTTTSSPATSSSPAATTPSATTTDTTTATSTDSATSTDPEPVCNSESLDLCDTQELCEEVNLYWYDNACHLESEEEPEEVCNSENLDLCITQAECETATGYWYNQTCNAEPEEICVPEWDCTDWQPEIDESLCGQTIEQTRNCTDLNECETDKGKPKEIQEVEAPKCPESEPEPNPEPESEPDLDSDL